MNNHSLICKFISEHSDDWRGLLAAKQIKVREEFPYAIFNYDMGADFSDPVVQEARGIILNLETLEVSCWPFRKFGNYQEPYADKIDWGTARVQEKIDGSIIKLWYDRANGKWRFSTNACINAADAPAMEGSRNFLEVIRSTDNYEKIPFDLLDRDTTYIFELVGSEVPHAVRYEYTRLFHTGTRNNVSGREEETDIGVYKPQQYNLHTLEDCIEWVGTVNENYKTEGIRHEGFVVVDGNWKRIKIKSPEYFLASRLVECGAFPYRTVIEKVRSKEMSFDDFEACMPRFKRMIAYYQWQMYEVEYKAECVCRLADQLYEEFSGDMKSVALALEKDPMKSIAFTHLNKGKGSKEILDEMLLTRYLKFIKPYEGEV